MVLGIKNVFELEGVIDSCQSCFNFLNRSIPFFLKEKIVLKLKEQKYITIEAPFVEEILGMATVKMLDKQEQVTVMLKCKFIRNRVTLNITNNTQETVMFEPKEMIGILDLRSLGYYKIGQGIPQQNLSKYYHFESADVWCEKFNKLLNMLKKEKEESKEKYPWPDKTDERKYMTDREILDKYINLENSCLTDTEKKEVRDMLYEYKEPFSLRDEIGTCPNIEVEIDIMDKTPFFIRPYHMKEEEKIP